MSQRAHIQAATPNVRCVLLCMASSSTVVVGRVDGKEPSSRKIRPGSTALRQRGICPTLCGDLCLEYHSECRPHAVWRSYGSIVLVARSDLRVITTAFPTCCLKRGSRSVVSRAQDARNGTHTCSQSVSQQPELPPSLTYPLKQCDRCENVLQMYLSLLP